MAKRVKQSSKTKQGKSKLTAKTSIQANGTKLNANHKSNGDFAKGNTAAKDHKDPAANKRQDFSLWFKEAVTCDDMKAIAMKMVVLAKNGNVKATKEVLDRCMGKAAQSLEVTGKGGGPIQIVNYAGASKK